MKLRNVLLNSLLLMQLSPVAAQRDIRFVEDSNVWLTSGNSAALTTLADSSISVASLTYAYEGGRLRNYSDGKHEMTLTAGVQSYYKLSSAVTAYGKVGYTNFSGTSMQGSMLYAPLMQPFDIIDDSLTNAGRKHLESFSITGAIGWNLCKSLAVGARADFTAGNYAKYKDLRHSNRLMSLNTELSLCHRIAGFGTIGASFLYRRNTETIRFKTYGTTDKRYYSLISYANFLGETENFGGEGFTDYSQEMPLLNEQAGFLLSTALKPGGALRSTELFLSFGYLHRNGYYGKQSQYTISHALHSGNQYNWKARLTLPAAGRVSLHFLGFSLSSEVLTTMRTNYRQVKDASNTSLIFYQYYAPTKVADKLLHQGTISYTAYLGSPYTWRISLGTHFWQRKQTAYLYPLVYTQYLNVWTPYTDVCRRISLAKGRMLTLEMGLLLTASSSEVPQDGILSAAPQTMSSIGRYLEQEYLTAPQFRCNFLARYEFPLRRVPTLRPHISLRYDLHHATGNVRYLGGSTRQLAALSVGATF